MALSKRIRFEVFKRDSFTCQYCGKKAPDVVLHVDHIHPKAEGGGDDILNLVTSCRDCNLGKGPRLLDDASVVERRRAQLEELQERREQIDMMVEWHRSVAGEKEHALESAAAYWSELVKDAFELNETGRTSIAKLIRRFGLAEVLEGMSIAVEHYIEYGKGDVPTHDSVERALNKIGGVCFNQRRYAQDPNEEEIDRQMWRFVRAYQWHCSSNVNSNELRQWWRKYVHPVLKDRPDVISKGADLALEACQDDHSPGMGWRYSLDVSGRNFSDYLPPPRGSDA